MANNNNKQVREMIDEVLNKVNKELGNIVEGDALIAEFEQIGASTDRNTSDALRRLAQNAKDAGHTIQGALKRVVNKLVDMGYTPNVTYSNGSLKITVNQDGEEIISQDILIKDIIGKKKVTPRVSIVYDKERKKAYLSDVGITFLEGLESSLNFVAKEAGKKRDRALKSGAKKAAAMARRGIIYNAQDMVLPEENEREREQATGSTARDLNLRTQLLFTNILNTALNNIAKKHQNDEQFKGMSFEKIKKVFLPKIQTYLEAMWANGEKAAKTTNKELGLTDTDLEIMDEIFGPEIYKMKPTMQSVGDSARQQQVMSFGGARTAFFHGRGDTSQHLQQITKYNRRLKRTSKIKRASNMRVKGIDSSFYEDPEQTMSTIAYVTNEQFAEKYEEAIREDEEQMRQITNDAIKEYRQTHQGAPNSDRAIRRYKETNPEEWAKVEALIDKRIAMMIPGLQDDQSVIRKGFVETLKTEDWVETEILPEMVAKIMDEYELSMEEAIEKLKKEIFVDTEEVKYDNFAMKEGEDGRFFISARRLTDFGGQSKLGGFLTGERTYGVTIKDKLFRNTLKKLGIAEEDIDNIDSIREKKEVSAKNIPGHIVSILSHYLEKHKGEKDFEQKINEYLKDAGLDGVIIYKDGDFTIDHIAFDAAMDENRTSFTKMMQVLEEKKMVDVQNGVVLINDIMNMLSTSEWKQNVNTGVRERTSIKNMASVAGAKGWQKQVDERYYNPENTDEYKRAQAEAELMSGALGRTFGTGHSQMSEEEVEQKIAESYNAQNTTGRTISIGSGEGYTINTNDLEDLEQQYKMGHLTEESYNQSVWGKIDAAKQKIIAEAKKAGVDIDPDNIEIFYDPKGRFQIKDASDNALSGRLLYIPSIQNIRIANGEENLYGTPVYSPEFSALIHSDESNRDKRAQNIIQRIFGDFHHKDGGIYKILNSRRAGNSKSFQDSAMSEDAIKKYAGEDADLFNTMLTSGFISVSSMRQMLNDRSAFKQRSDYIDALGAMSGLSTRYEDRAKEYKSKYNKEGMKDEVDEFFIERAIEEIIQKAKTQGISGLINRWPSVDTQAVHAAKVFAVEDNIWGRGKNTMGIGPALAHILKADFDGDMINTILPLLDKEALKQSKDVEEYARTIMLDVYAMYKADLSRRVNEINKENPYHTTTEEELKKADDDFANLISTVLTKHNKPGIGALSNISTKFRNMVEGVGLNEGSLTGNDADEKKEKVAQGIIAESAFQLAEQDVIDSKKVEQRVRAKLEKKGEDYDKLSKEKQDDEKAEIIASMLTEVDKLIEGVNSGTYTIDEYVKQLEQFGVLKDSGNGYWANTLGTKQAISIAKRILGEDKFKKLFVDTGYVDSETGAISAEGLKNALELTQTNIANAGGDRRGIFKALRNRDLLPGGKNDEHEVIRAYKALSTHAIEENTASQGKLGEAIDKLTRVIERLGGGYGRLIATPEHRKTISLTEWLNTKFPYESKEPRKDYSEILRRYRGLKLTEEQKEEFAKLTDEEKAKKLEVDPEIFKQAKRSVSTTKGDVIHNYIESKLTGEELTDKGKNALSAWSDYNTLYNLGTSTNKLEDTATQAAEFYKKKYGEEGYFAEINFNPYDAPLKTRVGGKYKLSSSLADSLTMRPDLIKFDGDTIHIRDIKTNAGGGVSPANIAQVLFYQDGLYKLINDVEKGRLAGKTIEQVATEQHYSVPFIEKLWDFETAKIESGEQKVLAGIDVIDKWNRMHEYNVGDLRSHQTIAQGLFSEGITPDGLALQLQNITTQGAVYTQLGEKIEPPPPTKSYDDIIKELEEYYKILKAIDDLQTKANKETNPQTQQALQGLINFQRIQLEQQEELLKNNIDPTTATILGGTNLTEEQKKLLEQYAMQQNLEHKLRVAQGLDNNNNMSRRSAQGNFWTSLFGGNAATAITTRVTSFARSLLNLRRMIDRVKKSTIELDKAATNIRIVTGMTQNDTRALMLSYSELAKQLGTTTVAVAKSANEWLRQGYSVAEANKLIKSSMQLSVLGMESAEQATSQITSALKGFKLEASEASKVVDVFTTLDADFAVSAGGIAEALSRVATSAQLAGLSLEQASAMVTVIGDVTQKSMTSVGESLQTVLARYGNVKANVFQSMETDGEEAGAALNDIEKVLGSVGIKIRNSSGEFRDFDIVLGEVAERYETFSNVQKNAIATALGGTRQRENINVLLNNWDKYKKALDDATESEGKAAKKYQAYTESIQYYQEQLNTAWEEMSQKINQSPFIKDIYKTLTWLVDILPGLIQGFSNILIMWSAAKIPNTLKQLGSFFLPVKNGNKTRGQNFMDNLDFVIGKKQYSDLDVEKQTEIGRIQRDVATIAKNTDPTKKGPRNGTGKSKSNKKSGTESVPADESANNGTGKPKSNIGGKIAYGITAGVASAATTLLTGSTTTDKMILGSNQNFQKGANIQMGEIWAQALTGGAARGIVGAIWGPLAGEAAGLATDAVMTGVKYLVHEQEVRQYERIQQALKNIDSLNKISDSLKTVSTSVLNIESVSTSEYIDAVRDIQQKLAQFPSLKPIIENMGGDVNTITKNLRSGDESTRVNALNIFNAAYYKKLSNELLASKEKELEMPYEEIKTKYALISQALASGNLDNLTVLGLGRQSEDYWRSQQSKLMTKIMNYESATEESNEYLARSAFYGSRMGGLNVFQQSGVSKEGLIYQVAQTLAQDEKYRGDVFNVGGQLSSDARQYIEDVIMDVYPNIASVATETVDEIFNKRDDILRAAEVETAKEAAEIAKGADDNLFKIGKALGYIDQSAKTENIQKYSAEIAKVRSLLLSIDPQLITNMANTLGLTTEQFERMRDVFGFMTSDTILGGMTELNKVFERFSTLIDEIVKKGTQGLSSQTIDETLKNAPYLLQGKNGELSVDNIVGNIIDIALGNGGGIRTMGGLRGKEMATNQDIWKQTRESILSKLELSDELRKKLESDAIISFDKAMEAIINSGEEVDADEFAKAFADATDEIIGDIENIKQVREQAISYQNKLYDNEIDNLKSIMDSLDDVNKRRERELKLIKAKDALENAQKEQVLTYREGVGFIYSADTEAISKAQEDVDAAERELNKENLQYQIDLLEQQKNILSDIATNENWKYVEQIHREVQASVGKETSIYEAIQQLGSSDAYKKAVVDVLSGYKKVTDENINAAKNRATEFGSAAKAYQTAADAVNQDPTDQAITDYNEALAYLQSVIGTMSTSDVQYIDDETVKKYWENRDILNAAGEYQANFIPTENTYRWRNKDRIGSGESMTSYGFDAGDVYGVYKWDPVKQKLERVGQTYKSNLNYFKKDGSTEKISTVGYFMQNQQDGQWEYVTGGSMDKDGVMTSIFYKSMSREAMEKDILKNHVANNVSTFASGTLSSPAGLALINELGTEGIVTPNGTLTALDSGTGVIPADLTRNLYNLGEVAPNLIKQMKDYSQLLETKNYHNVEDNSTNIDKLYATFETQDGFDAEEFIRQVKGIYHTSKHN